MPLEQITHIDSSDKASKPTIVTVHGEHQTLWHIVDDNAPEAEQPAVLKTFSSITATREYATRFLHGFAERS